METARGTGWGEPRDAAGSRASASARPVPRPAWRRPLCRGRWGLPGRPSPPPRPVRLNRLRVGGPQQPILRGLRSHKRPMCDARLCGDRAGDSPGGRRVSPPPVRLALPASCTRDTGPNVSHRHPRVPSVRNGACPRGHLQARGGPVRMGVRGWSTLPPRLWPHPSTLHLVTAANGAPHTGGPGGHRVRHQREDMRLSLQLSPEPPALGAAGPLPSARRGVGRSSLQVR